MTRHIVWQDTTADGALVVRIFEGTNANEQKYGIELVTLDLDTPVGVENHLVTPIDFDMYYFDAERRAESIVSLLETSKF